MKKELSKAYDAVKHEDEVYKDWEESGYFNPDNLACSEEAENYSIVMPPPNVTGILHIGHATMLALQDVLIRYNRMQGKRTLWVPGTDHASIATSAKVEKVLREEGTSKQELGRDAFLKRVVQYAQESHDTIVGQVKKMGSSCDWSREAYTLDETRSKAVRSIFKLMHDDGLIYRGERVVNWCSHCQSTLSDDEVDHHEKSSKLYTFKYSKDFPFSISTTRPETKLGDTGVAVNIRDKRYNEYIGKTFDVDFAGVKLELKVVADREIDMEFGSGAVGVTPAHSFTDWRIKESNDLKIVKVINEDGLVNEGFGEYSGLNVEDARSLVVKRLKEDGLLTEEVDIKNNISVCYRCNSPVEPIPSLQWFIDVNKKISKFNKTVKELCLEAVNSGVFGNDKINIIPERFIKSYLHWTENLRDWCISRQIWYGHRVPVWYKKDNTSEIFVGVEAPEGDDWVQDNDTLDTWFSSGLWTFSTMASDPDEITIKDGKVRVDTNDFKLFHPTNVLETGYDILPFWVARMILMTTYGVGDVPFKDVYLHGLVLDEKGRKMSKSLGNVINPVDVIEKFGTDAVRLSVIIGTNPGNNLKISEEKIANYRNFTNKLWNISRYILGAYDLNLDDKISEIHKLTNADKWILFKLDELVKKTNIHLEKYQFSMAGEGVKDFCWNDLADWYLEVAKFEKTKSKPILLKYILETVLKLWHPFMPFVTEVIWKEMGNTVLLMVSNWPTAQTHKEISEESIDNFVLLKSLIVGVRNIRSQFKITPANKIKATIITEDKVDLINNNKQLIQNLRTGLSEINVLEKGEKIKNAIYFNVGRVEIYLKVPNLDIKAEKIRLDKEIKGKSNAIERLRTKLENSDFVNNAPFDIIKTEREKLGLWSDELQQMQGQYNNL